MHSSKLRTYLNLNSLRNNIAKSLSVTKHLSNVEGTEKVELSDPKSWEEIPGPSSLPIIGQTHHFFPGGSFYNMNSKDLYNELHKRYGPISKVKLVLTPLIVFISDPDIIQQLHRGENTEPHRPGFITLDYYRRHYKKAKDQPCQHVGLITEQGEKWKSFRNIVNPVFLHPNIVKKYSNAIDEVAKDMMLRLKSLRDQHNMVPNIHNEFKLWTLETISLIALGCRINCLDKDLKENSQAKKLINYTIEVINIADTLDVKPAIWKYYPTKTFKKAMKIYQGLEETTLHFIHMAKEELNSNKLESEKSVLEKLLEIDEDIAVVMACDMLMAGIDTTSNTLLSTLYLLAMNQDKQQKLRESLMSNDHKYLKACIRESMRMMPVVNANARITTKEHNIRGYMVPKDVIVTFNHQMLSLDENQYPRPDEFIPERWLVGKEDPLFYRNAHPFASLPFGFGVRTCLGRRIAALEMETMLINLLDTFSIEWHGPPPVIKYCHVNHVEGLNFVLNDIK